MSATGTPHPVQVISSPGGRLTVVLDRGFEPSEVLAVLAEAAEDAPAEPAPLSPVRQSPRHYPGEFLG
jgi:hypothetical protein